MMAGSGVGGVGGVGMLRTRRRDVSVKPNRKLDRKSSRGMIYENEELRLRTIHINAEVEQGQNDIKKLRRENEQLRREIWSLRDEYDKLEDILKKQKNRESEEYEDRSEEDDGLQSDFSCEEDEEEYEDNEKTVKDLNQEEQLENAENQKISSEKMSSNMHRLHVEFDDLSVVDEEEEPKRDKDKKETTPEKENEAVGHPPPPVLSPRQLHENIPFYPATYEPTSAFSGTSYYTECPFEFPSTMDLMLSADTSALLASPYSGLQPDPLIPLANLDAAGLEMADPTLPQIHVPPVGWQNDVVSQNQVPTYTGGIAPVTPGAERPNSHPLIVSSLGSSVPASNTFGFFKRRNASTKQPTKLQDASATQDSRTQFPCSEEAVGRNVWNVDSLESAVANREQNMQRVGNTEETTTMFTVPEKPRHFFAPQPFKLNKQEEESPTASVSHFGTGTSSSSGKTASTVISRTNPFVGLKGSADIYINGAIPCEDATRDKNDPRTFLSTDNLLIADSKTALDGQLTKSLSCQDLTSDSQSVAQQLKLNHAESQMLTKSDNTLDNMSGSSSKPYKSHLNVTLKIPRVEQASSPETPEIPNLPSIDYRLFRNPFLRNFDKIRPNYQVKSNPPPASTPLSIQVNDDGLAYPYPMPGYGRDVHLNERFRAAHLPDQSRLLIPSDQVMSGKQDIQVTSFERPSPCNLVPSAAPYDLTSLRRLNANRYLQNQNLYQNIPYASRGPGQFCSQRCGIMYYDNVTKVPAQTQTSIDGDSHHEDEETISAPNSPNGQRRRKIAKKDKALIKDPNPLSPTAQRKLKKQTSVISTDALDSPGKITRKKPRRMSTMTSDAQENKNESRSSSSGQDSPRKDQNRRMSVYINSKRRSSQASLKTSRSGSVDAKDKFTDGTALNLERERTNSVSSREITNVKARKTSTSSGNVPWCACWGNGCI